MQDSTQYQGLLPVEPIDEPPPVRPTTLENDPFPNGRSSFRKRASRPLFRFLITFCIGVAATLVWQSHGDAARRMIANSYPLLGWLAPQAEAVAQIAPDMIELVALPTRQLRAISLELGAVQQSIDRIAGGQGQIQEQIIRSVGQIAAGQAQLARSIEQITANQEQTTRGVDQTATSMARAASAKASGITVESRADGESSPPTVNTPIEARPPPTSPERGKQLSAPSAQDPSCYPSASAVLQDNPGGWPTWTLRATGHESTMCWYAAARPRGGDHRPRSK
jgi:hypothetical protein